MDKLIVLIPRELLQDDKMHLNIATCSYVGALSSYLDSQETSQAFPETVGVPKVCGLLGRL